MLNLLNPKHSTIYGFFYSVHKLFSAFRRYQRKLCYIGFFILREHEIVFATDFKSIDLKLIYVPALLFPDPYFVYTLGKFIWLILLQTRSSLEYNH